MDVDKMRENSVEIIRDCFLLVTRERIIDGRNRR